MSRMRRNGKKFLETGELAKKCLETEEIEEEKMSSNFLTKLRVKQSLVLTNNLGEICFLAGRGVCVCVCVWCEY